MPRKKGWRHKKGGKAHAPVAVKPVPVERPPDVDEEYDVEKINGHARRPEKTGTLFYNVSWVGYPGEESWLSEYDASDCRPLVDAYWASLPPERQKERTTTRLSHKRKKKEEEKPDEPEEPVASTSTAPAPAPPSPGTVALIPAPSSAPDPDSQAESTQHSALRYRDQAKSAYGDGRGDRSPTRRASTVEPKDEPDDGMPLFSGNSSQSGIEDLLRQVALGEPVEEDEEDWRQSGQSDEGSQEDYSLIADWESLVKHFEDTEKDEDGQRFFLVVWKDTDAFSWISNDVARTRCPQKLLDYYESLTRFGPKEETVDPVIGDLLPPREGSAGNEEPVVEEEAAGNDELVEKEAAGNEEPVVEEGVEQDAEEEEKEDEVEDEEMDDDTGASAASNASEWKPEAELGSDEDD